MAKSLFEEIFDGPDSLFGQVFGPSREKLRQNKRAAANNPNTIRIKVSKAQLKMISEGKSLNFKFNSGFVLIQPSGQ
jgi:hypothetical protein